MIGFEERIRVTAFEEHIRVTASALHKIFLLRTLDCFITSAQLAEQVMVDCNTQMSWSSLIELLCNKRKSSSSKALEPCQIAMTK